MRVRLFIFLILFADLNAFSQISPIIGLTIADPKPQLSLASDTLYFQDFGTGLPSDWSIIDNKGSGEVWKWTLTGASSGPPGFLNSLNSSASNGYMVFDSDSGGASSGPELCDLVSPFIDCSNQSTVFLAFNEYFRQFDISQGTVSLSVNQGVNWIKIYDADSLLAQNQGTANPHWVINDISNLVSGHDSVLIRFRYAGNWDWYWMIDDFLVFTAPEHDLAATWVSYPGAEYTYIPLSEATAIALSAEIRNLGSQTLIGASAEIQVIDSSTNSVLFTELLPLQAIHPFESQLIQTQQNFTASSTGTVYSKLGISHPFDTLSANNTISSILNLNISDSVYARDNGSDYGSIGIGAGPANGVIGQIFSPKNPLKLKSFRFFLRGGLMNPNPAGSPVWLSLHRLDSLNQPDFNQVVALSDTFLLLPGSIPSNGQYFDLAVSGGPLSLSPGSYYAGIHEADSTLPLGTSESIFSESASWIHWDGIPSPPALNGWAHSGDFGVEAALRIRLTIATTQDLPPLVSTENSSLHLFPNPGFGLVHWDYSGSITEPFTLFVTDQIGRPVWTQEKALSPIDLRHLSPGLYLIRLESKDNRLTAKYLLR